MTSGWAWLLFERPLLPSDGSVGCVKVMRDLSEPMFMSGELDTSREIKGAQHLSHYIQRSRHRAESFCRRKPRTCVVLESFQLRERTSDSSLTSPERLNSRLEQELSHLDFEVELYYQTPADAKNVCKDSRMKKWGLWVPGRPHETDARRHLLLWLRKEANGEHG